MPPRSHFMFDTKAKVCWELLCAACVCVAGGCGEDVAVPAVGPKVAADGCYHVHPGEEIQRAVEAAGSDASHKTVVVHAGDYRPQGPRQALVHFNARHDGVSLIARGDVTLHGGNPQLADSTDPRYPGLVNHIVYFGHGVTDRTVLKGFRLTGATGFVTNVDIPPGMEPEMHAARLERGPLFYVDGGGIKVFGRSSPQLLDLEVVDNAARMCGGGINIEQRGYLEAPVRIQNCIFRNNRCPGTGSAVDILSGSSAVIENCLFVGNISNTGMDDIKREVGLEHHPEHGAGALTVFPTSRVEVRRCTFTGNWNGADDEGEGNTYADCIFWNNVAGNRSRPGGPYEIDIRDATNVRNCWLSGEKDDLRGSLDPGSNVLRAPDPQFDEFHQPRNPKYEMVGYRRATPPDDR